MSTVRILDLERLHSSIRADLDAAYEKVVGSSSFVGSHSCRDFESAFATLHGRREGIGCASGTDALVLALRALGIGPGDDVIVPAFTFIATAEAVVHVGATPVLADVDPTTLLITEETVDSVRTAASRAVIPVHLYGHPVEFTAIKEWKNQGLVVIEDAAQAHLATWDGHPMGEYGDAACFSFYPGKNLGALGDGGLVLTDDTTVAERIRKLRDHGRISNYEYEMIGWCTRLDGLQAAFLEAKLPYLRSWTASRSRWAEQYSDNLKDVSGIRLVPWKEGAVHHLVVARIAHGRRDTVKDVLSESGIETAIHYPIPLSRQECLREFSRPCPSADAAAGEVLTLPLDPLMSADDVDFVCDVLRTTLNS